MMEETKNAGPVLTLNPFEEIREEPHAPALPEEAAEVSVAVETAAEEKKEAPVFDESTLTPEERKMVDDFARAIDLNNSTVVLQYGAGAQKKIADFSETALANVRSKDLGEIGELLSGVVCELKKFDEEEEKGLFGLFKKSSNKITAMKSKYDKAEANINKICGVLEGHQIQLLKDTAM
ncbi:MAG: toxic anion resistance protein, partial [Kineothrix sp.]|nr:toxic anion resistance protein [Kineothrix sp.]